jgi:hypothetical protein
MYNIMTMTNNSNPLKKQFQNVKKLKILYLSMEKLIVMDINENVPNFF